jgi:hypothetical protein
VKIILIPLLAGIVSVCSCQQHEALATTNASQKSTVIELFTSEGCSSCPSADKLLAEMSDKNPNILQLSFHVDYWNRLGWVDSFSNAQFTKRQYNYAARMQLSSVYTPQVVVNGQAETVGSNSAKVYRLLAAKYPSSSIINQVKATVNNKSVSVNIDAKQLPKNYELLALLIQPHAATKVKAGENGGSFLQHKNVVRDMVSVPLNSNGAILTAPFLSNDWKVAIIVQDKNNLQIADAFLVNVTYL